MSIAIITAKIQAQERLAELITRQAMTTDPEARSALDKEIRRVQRTLKALEES